MKSDSFWRDILGQWGFEFAETRPDLCIMGSPNRAEQRIVLQTVQGEHLVLEAVPNRKRDQRDQQFRTLEFLSQHGVKNLQPWQKTCSGETGVLAEGAFWQLRRYVSGEELPRDTYGNDGWRGKVLADWLAELIQVSQSVIMPLASHGRFLLKRYIPFLLTQIQHILPPLIDDVKPILEELQEFLSMEEQLPESFAHGDFHPGNIIWGSHDRINAVIDWEFCGRKTAGYDAANLLGCLGMDEPAYLTGPMAMSFIRTLRETAALDAQTWHYLADHIAALRFGWLREWVVQKNKDMICQELDFIWLILDNRDLLRRKWL